MVQVKADKYHRRIRECGVMQVVHVVCAEGEGTEDDLVRLVHYYYSFDGQLLARQDSWEEERRLEA